MNKEIQAGGTLQGSIENREKAFESQGLDKSNDAVNAANNERMNAEGMELEGRQNIYSQPTAPNVDNREVIRSFIPPTDIVDFNMGYVEASASTTSGKSRNSKPRTSSWSRKKRNNNDLTKSGIDTGKDQIDLEVDLSVKRKVVDLTVVSSKLSKQAAGLKVHQKPSSTNI